MKVLHVTKTRAGGAGIAAARTVAALRAAGVDATLWTEGAPGMGPGPGTRRRWLLDKLDSVPTRLRWRYRRFAAWSNNWRQTDLAEAINAATPDIVHLHWIGQGFMNLDELAAIRAPIVWTMHDAWPFTGGCHYPADCRRYEAACGACPQLSSHRTTDLSARNHRSKAAALPHVARWIAPSRWMAECAAASPLVPAEKVRVIPNAFAVTTWPALPRSEARRRLGIDPAAFVLIAGSMNLREPRKGGQLLAPALDAIAGAHNGPVVLLLFGSGRIGATTGRSWTARYFGRLSSEPDLAALYSAADLAVMPSLQDNLPWFAIEAHASGCPVVAFDSGGIRDIVIDGATGLLVSEFSPAALARAVAQWNQSKPSPDAIARQCISRVANLCSPENHAAALVREYNELLAARSRPVSR